MASLLDKFKIEGCEMVHKPNSINYYENLSIFPLDFYIIHDHHKGKVMVCDVNDENLIDIESHNYSDQWLFNVIKGTGEYRDFIKQFNLKKLMYKL